MRIPTEEQETIIRIGRTEDFAEISTTDSRYITKLDKLVNNNSDEWECTDEVKINGNVVEKFYRCPVNLVSFRAKTTTRVMTDEQREAAAERMRKYQENKKLNSVDN